MNLRSKNFSRKFILPKYILQPEIMYLYAYITFRKTHYYKSNIHVLLLLKSKAKTVCYSD